jgi:ketosteroid isomerase-like protein
MRRSSAWYLIAIVAAGCSSGGSNDDSAGASAPALSVQDSTAVVALMDRKTAAAAANDWKTWNAEYSDDAVELPPNSPKIQGRAAIDQAPAGPKLTSFTAQSEHVFGSGDLAVARGSYDLSWEAGPGMPAGKDTGKFVSVFRKQADGSWKCIIDIWNSNNAPAPMGAATTTS